MTNRIGWIVMAFLALCVACYAMAMLTVTHVRSPFVVHLFARAPLPVTLHLAGGALALMCGSLQFSSALRRRHLSVHRMLGRIYIVAVSTSGLAALVLSTHSAQGMLTHFGFGLLAVCWIGTALKAYHCARTRQIALHRAWMVRSFALTLAAVTLRIYLPLSQVLGFPFGASYIAISWLCWIPNLLIANWWLRIERQRRERSVPTPDAQPVAELL